MRGTFSSPLISTISAAFKEMFLSVFLFRLHDVAAVHSILHLKTFSTDHSLALAYICKVY